MLRIANGRQTAEGKDRAELEALRSRMDVERAQAIESFSRIESERNSLAARLRDQEATLSRRTDDAERLKTLLHHKEAEVADLDRLLGEYRTQIKSLAEKCSALEASARTDRARTAGAKARKGRPMDPTEWNFDKPEGNAGQGQPHPLAGIEAKAVREILDWQKTKNGNTK
jgi:chromosome segregation ATPase